METTVKELLLKMGHIIRHLDENCQYQEYWTLDGLKIDGNDDYLQNDIYMENFEQQRKGTKSC